MSTSYDQGMDKQQWFTRNESGGMVPLESQADIDDAMDAGRPVFVLAPEHLSPAPETSPAWPEGWISIGATKDTAGGVFEGQG